MITYFDFSTFHIGPIAFHVWGIMVALGFIVSVLVARALVRRRGGDPETMSSLALWMLGGAAVGARLVHALVYFPSDYLRDPVEILRIWNGGLSSLGGFVGGSLAALTYLRRRGQTSNVKRQMYFFAAVFAFPWGYAIGRIGCYLTHMHPGRLTSSILGVRYPGGTRYDGGLIEAVNGLLMGITILIVRRLTRRDDIAVASGVLWYAIVRFFTDFLRSSDLPTSDIRWYGLTPAQFGMILILLILFLYALPRLQARVTRY